MKEILHQPLKRVSRQTLVICSSQTYKGANRTDAECVRRASREHLTGSKLVSHGRGWGEDSHAHNLSRHTPALLPEGSYSHPKANTLVRRLS
jgi:hypothetical protein